LNTSLGVEVNKNFRNHCRANYVDVTPPPGTASINKALVWDKTTLFRIRDIWFDYTLLNRGLSLVDPRHNTTHKVPEIRVQIRP